MAIVLAKWTIFAVGSLASLEASVLDGFRVAQLESLCCQADPPIALLECANKTAIRSVGKVPRVALVTLVTPEISGNSYVAFTAAINAAYAETFGHMFVALRGTSRFGSGNQAAHIWRAGNVAAVLDILEMGAYGADWIAWLDADAALLDFSSQDTMLETIERHTTAETRMLMCRGELIGPGSSSLFNSGFMLLMRHPWTLRLVRRWLTELEQSTENDQEALERLHRANVMELQRRLVLLPQGLFYSEIGDPIAGPPQTQHLVHLAGVPGDVREAVFRQFWFALCAAAAEQELGRTGTPPPLRQKAETVARRGIAIHASPQSDALRTIYLEEASSWVQARTEEGATEACSRQVTHRLPHVSAADAARSCLELAERLAFGLLKQRRVSEAVVWAQAAFSGKERWLGPLDADTLSSLSTSADIAEADGRLEDAVAAAQRVLQGRQLTYGVHHRATLLSELKLGVRLQALGHLDEAEVHIVNGAKMLAQVLGAGHPSALNAALHSALLKKRQRRMEEAAYIFGASTRDASHELGSMHAVALDLQQGLVDTLVDLGRVSEARRHGRRLVQRCRRAAATQRARADHRTARALDTLAAALANIAPRGGVRGAGASPKKALSEAAALRQEAAEIYATVLGHGSLQEVSALQGVAESVHAQGHVAEAERWFRRAWSVGRGALDAAEASGASKLDKTRAAVVAGVANNLGMLLRGRGSGGGGGSGKTSAAQEEVEHLLRAAMRGFQLDSQHQQGLRAMGNLADHLRSIGRVTEALPLSTQSLAGLEVLGSIAAADRLIGQSNLALTLYAAGRNREAEAGYREVVAGYEATHGKASAEAASARSDLQELLRRLGRGAEAGIAGRLGAEL